MVNIKSIAKEMDLKIPAEILDEETGEILSTDGEKIKKAFTIVAEVRHSLVKMSKQVCNFFDEKLYLYLGLTKAEACEKLFGMNIRTVSNLQLVHRKLGSDLESLEFLGIGKLNAIASLPQEQREDLVADGKLELANGEILSLEEIADTKVKELEKKLRSEKLKNSKLKNEKEELVKEYDAEVEDLKNTVNDLDSLVNIKPEDRDFHKKITKTRESQNLILEAQSNVHTAFLKLAQLEVTDKNNSILSDIEGFLVMTANRILDAEAQFDLNLGKYKESLQEIAG